MTPENFVYWLQGYLELSEDRDISSTQVQIIKDHVALVLQKKPPSYNQYFMPVNDDLVLRTKTPPLKESYDDTFCRLNYPDGPPATC